MPDAWHRKGTICARDEDSASHDMYNLKARNGMNRARDLGTWEDSKEEELPVGGEHGKGRELEYCRYDRVILFN